VNEPTPYQRLFVEATKNLVPLDVVLELTQRCNFRCRHCYIPDFHSPDLLNMDRVLGLVEELAGLGTLRLTLSGGEVFLRRDWAEIAHRSRRLGFEVRVFTNGSLITEEVADELAALCATVEISLHASRAKEFDDFTRVPGSFRKVERGIRLARERGVEVLLKVPVTVHNYREIDAVHAFAESLGTRCTSYPAIMPAKDGNRAPLAQRAPERLLLPYYAGPHSERALPDPDRSDEGTDGPLCAAAARLACVTSSGDVLPCVVLPLVAGNVRTQSFREIWENSPVMHRIRAIRRVDLKPCDACEKFAYCERCHAQALGEDGDLLGPSAWSCEHATVVEEASRRRGT